MAEGGQHPDCAGWRQSDVIRLMARGETGVRGRPVHPKWPPEVTRGTWTYTAGGWCLVPLVQFLLLITMG